MIGGCVGYGTGSCGRHAWVPAVDARFVVTSRPCAGPSVGMKPAAERRGPREDLRAMYERQDNALAACLALGARAVKLRAALAELDSEQQAALGAFADITGSDVAASVTGTPVA